MEFHFDAYSLVRTHKYISTRVYRCLDGLSISLYASLLAYLWYIYTHTHSHARTRFKRILDRYRESDINIVCHSKHRWIQWNLIWSHQHFELITMCCVCIYKYNSIPILSYGFKWLQSTYLLCLHWSRNGPKAARKTSHTHKALKAWWFFLTLCVCA